MKRVLIGAAVAAACLAMSACSTTADPAKILETLGSNYAHCERTVNYTATVGALNPASGATVSGSVRCPPKTAAPATGVPITDPSPET